MAKTSTKKFALGVDYGTNSVRALIVDVADGSEVGTAVFNYRAGKDGILLDSRDPNVARQHPDVLSRFLALYRESVSFVNDKPQEAAKDIVAAGILPSEALAEKAIPLSHIVDVTGEEMKAQLAPLFEILLAANPASVGGKLPDADFYYIAK